MVGLFFQKLFSKIQNLAFFKTEFSLFQLQAAGNPGPGSWGWEHPWENDEKGSRKLRSPLSVRSRFKPCGQLRHCDGYRDIHFEQNSEAVMLTELI